jgi:hypoxanthine-DNA glycosylase
MKVFSFAPIADENSRVLILGTMPGVMSLKKQQYYGFERNAFWRIIYNIFDSEPDEDYDMRRDFLLSHGIALWDVLKACEREGSSDSEIRDPEPNDFESFYSTYPQIRDVCFNGGPAARLYQRFVVKKDLSFHRLPSTSPAYTLPYEKKLEQWQLVRRLLQKHGVT